MKKGYKIASIVLAVIACFCLVISSVGVFFAVSDGLCEQSAHFVPLYQKIDLSPILAKEVWSDEDYETLYRQTGLTKAGLESVEREDIPEFQDALFFDGRLYHEYTTPITPHDRYMDPETEQSFAAPMVSLEAGDILVTSTTHLFGWRHGHAALVTNGSTGALLESVAIGIDSKVSINGTSWFRRSSNFMVLRLKGADAETRAKIAKDAVERLSGLSYNVFVGFFLPKDQCKNGRTPTSTHCSHLVWQAYMNAGYDLDPTGGPLVTPKDIASSPYLEVLQVYGFDLDKLWK